MDLRWRTVVVTGAGGALGQEVALRFARAGAGVVAVDRDAAAAQRTADLVRARRVVVVSAAAPAPTVEGLVPDDVRVTHVVIGTAPDSAAAAAVLDLVRRGAHGEVVDLGAGAAGASPDPPPG